MWKKKKAKAIAVVIDLRGDARIYRLTPPMVTKDPLSGEGRAHHYVLVSAADVPHTGPETHIYPCTPDASHIEWSELPGSYRGGVDHERALKNAGYRITYW